jgi:flagellar biosynthetic protein FliR
MPTLESFLETHVYAFILCFTRVGTAAMIMPGVGDSFVPANVRLYFCLALSVVLTPMIVTYLPNPIPAGALFFAILFLEFLTGAFIGTIARIFMSITDTAGMIISFQAGLSNAQLFNPMMAGQGSLIGAFLSITAATLLFSLNLHHLLIVGLINSYDRFPIGDIPDVASMTQVVSQSLSAAFMIAIQISAPFIVLILIIYAAMGVLSKLMPTLQIFMLAMPVQILLALVLLVLSLSSMLLFFAEQYRSHLGSLLGG